MAPGQRVGCSGICSGRRNVREREVYVQPHLLIAVRAEWGLALQHTIYLSRCLPYVSNNRHRDGDWELMPPSTCYFLKIQTAGAAIYIAGRGEFVYPEFCAFAKSRSRFTFDIRLTLPFSAPR